MLSNAWHHRVKFRNKHDTMESNSAISMTPWSRIPQYAWHVRVRIPQYPWHHRVEFRNMYDTSESEFRNMHDTSESEFCNVYDTSDSEFRNIHDTIKSNSAICTYDTSESEFCNMHDTLDSEFCNMHDTSVLGIKDYCLEQTVRDVQYVLIAVFSCDFSAWRENKSILTKNWKNSLTVWRKTRIERTTSIILLSKNIQTYCFLTFYTEHYCCSY